MNLLYMVFVLTYKNCEMFWSKMENGSKQSFLIHDQIRVRWISCRHNKICNNKRRIPLQQLVHLRIVLERIFHACTTKKCTRLLCPISQKHHAIAKYNMPPQSTTCFLKSVPLEEILFQLSTTFYVLPNNHTNCYTVSAEFTSFHSFFHHTIVTKTNIPKTEIPYIPIYIQLS